MKSIIDSITRAMGNDSAVRRRWSRAGLSTMLLLASACGDWTLDFGGSDTDDDAATSDAGDGDTDGPTGTDGDSTAGDESDSGSDESAASECNNAIIEGDEECDRAELGGQDCMSLGFDGGELSCTSECAFDTSACMVDTCNNDSIDEGEVCDGSDLGGETCESLGFDGGELGCADNCMALDRSGCYDDGPGNGDDCCAVGAGPGCMDLGCETSVCAEDPFCCEHSWDQICVDRANENAECLGAGDSCPADSECNNDMLEADEVCDGAQVGEETCEGLGFESGTLGCADDCQSVDTSTCVAFAGQCCGSNGSPGCDDAACTLAVCAQDAYCCETSWDGVCASAASVEAACSAASACE